MRPICLRANRKMKGTRRPLQGSSRDAGGEKRANAGWGWRVHGPGGRYRYPRENRGGWHSAPLHQNIRWRQETKAAETTPNNCLSPLGMTRLAHSPNIGRFRFTHDVRFHNYVFTIIDITWFPQYCISYVSYIAWLHLVSWHTLDLCRSFYCGKYHTSSDYWYMPRVVSQKTCVVKYM